ncbi:MAG: TSUP family transporter [Planctomycetota bacterium]
MVALAVMSFGVGILTGLFGVGGGGVLHMPPLLLVVGLSVHQTVGTSLGVVLLNASAGALSHGAMGNVTMIVVLPAAVVVVVVKLVFQLTG